MNDIIRRQDAIDAVHEEFDEVIVWDESGKRTADEFEDIIAIVPSAQPEREKGHWIDKTDPDWNGEWDDWQCSCCGSLITSMARNLNGLYLYCPKCGARMEETDEDD